MMQKNLSVGIGAVDRYLKVQGKESLDDLFQTFNYVAFVDSAQASRSLGSAKYAFYCHKRSI